MKIRRTGEVIDKPRQVAATTLPTPGWRLTDSSVSASSSLLSVTATASATPHTKGSWTQVIAATTADVTMLEVQILGTSVAAADSSALLDIGIGAAAAEVVVVANLAAGYRPPASGNSVTPAGGYTIPLFIPAGSRVAVRMQSVAISATATVRVKFGTAPFSKIPSTSVVTIGANTTTSRGVDLTVTTVNTKAAYTQITAATTEPFDGFMFGLQGGGDTTLATSTALVDIAVGASGSEVVMINDILVTTGSSETLMVQLPMLSFFRYPVPAGSRLAATVSRASSLDSFDLILYGIRRA